jgi:hypothetical protein
LVSTIASAFRQWGDFSCGVHPKRRIYRGISIRTAAGSWGAVRLLLAKHAHNRAEASVISANDQLGNRCNETHHTMQSFFHEVLEAVKTAKA